MTGWIAAVIISAVLNGLCQGLVLAALVWLALRTIPRLSAATRHAVWMLTLALVIALPLVESLSPVASLSDGESTASMAAGGGAAITLPAAAPWLFWALAAWAVISLALLVRVAWSYKLLQNLKRRAVPLPPEYQERFDVLQNACPGRRRAALLASDEIASPVAAGFLRPAVMVPSFLVDRLSVPELGDVLTHELAHLRRWDDLTNTVQHFVEALAFFHPAVLWIGRRLSLEREIACDDWVVARTGTPRPYAACLAKLAALIPAASPQLAPGLSARKPQVSIRVEALLAKRCHGKARASKAALALASAALVLGGTAALPLAPVGIAPSPVAAVAAPRMTASVPAAAYAPKAAPPVAFASLRKPPKHSLPLAAARVRASGRTPAVLPVRALPASVQEEAVVATRQQPVTDYVVVCVSGDQGGWIQVVWFRVARAAVLSQI
jgi:beta-lactamase regulating signal transducer with metallopeptidase domain